jgi:histone deacetylase 1/2
MQAMHTMLHPAPPASNSSRSSQVWLTDSGATNHMTADLNNLTLASPYPTADTIYTANGEGLTVSHVGQSIINSSMSSFKLDSVLLVPQLTQNLLSVHRLCLDNNCWLIFYAYCFWIQDKAARRILYRGLCSNGMYPIHASSSSSFTQSSPAQAFLGQLVQSNLWHHRLGHPTNSVVSLMLNKAHIPVPKTSSPIMCHPCLARKVRKLPFPQHHHKFNSPFATIHTDLWGPAPCISVDGYRYYTIFVNECTRFCWLFPLVNKSDLFSTFAAFYNLIVTQYSATVKILQSDGGEYTCNRLQQFLLDKGITHHLSCPHTLEQNGVAERKHRHIMETTITLLHTGKLPSQFWSYACLTAAYLINRMPTPVLLHKSPFELLFGSSPELNHLRIFRCACFPLLRPYNHNKLQPKTSKCVFLGYSHKYKGYLCYHVPTLRLYVSRHVIFEETQFPYPESSPSLLTTQPLPSSASSTCPVLLVNTENTVITSSPVSPSHHTPSISTVSPSSQSITASIQASPPPPVAPDISISSSTFNLDNLQVVLSIPSLNLHPMQTKSKSGITKQKAFLASIQDSSMVDLSLTEPATYKSAIKAPVWLQAMQDEITALHTQGTWSLVPLPSKRNLVGCKWIFKIKCHSDGSIARHKARLVAKGFSQEPGLDYGDTFSPVVKPATIRLVLALTAHFNWPLRQLDVKNAFLHAILQEEVYMSQPPGFEDSVHPHHVCKLHKSLYGLKQAPRAWNARFTQFLPSLGFATTYSDSSLFVKYVGSQIVVLLLYVDDIILKGNASAAILQVIQALSTEFDITDLGSLYFFLGI